jgi:hypothetical protein
VSLFGYIFDYAPQSFVKGILVHEAHRHPYIERLFAMYMMKLKDDSFGREAGACWRQLFVAALMPWFVRLRVFSDERLGDFSGEYNARRREGQSPLQISQHAWLDADKASNQSQARNESAPGNKSSVNSQPGGNRPDSRSLSPQMITGEGSVGTEHTSTADDFVPDDDVSHYLPLS